MSLPRVHSFPWIFFPAKNGDQYCVQRKFPCVESDSDLEPGTYSLQKFFLYETEARFYLIGKDEQSSRWRVLKIDRTEKDLNIYEDPAIYSKEDCLDLLKRLAEGNRKHGGINLVTKAYGIIGFVKFLEPYYIILITKRRFLGSICGHSIYAISKTRLLMIPHPSLLTSLAVSQSEKRYIRLFNSINLSRDFFYSYTYRAMWTLQRNDITGKKQKNLYDDMFVWNSFLTRGYRTLLKSTYWIVPLVHGFFRQEKLVIENVSFTLTLIARRSRHYAGTRYLKRGVNAKGRVANDVETEQLIADETGQISSIVQHRGSIPLYWSQETAVLSVKPEIILHKKDSEYEATALHFENLAARYGNPIVVLNLVKTMEKKPRETILCREFATSVAYINHKLPKTDRIKFIQFDLHFFAKRQNKSINMLEILENIASTVLDLVGFYCSGKDLRNNTRHDELKPPVRRMLQHGVLRTNCIDCLDRTNVAQYAFGLAALGRQLHALGLWSNNLAGSNSNLGITLMEFYESMGDTLALQYGGSPAHNKLFLQWQGKWNATIQSQELFRAFLRHYSNAYLDGEKQDAINIFLGNFRPEASKPDLWQLDSDNHLKFRRVGDDPENDLRLSFRRSLSAGSTVEMVDNATILSSGVASQMDSNATQKLRPFKSSFNTANKSLTLSDAELHQCLEDVGRSGSYSDSDIRSEGGLCESTDASWMSSSGDEVQERHITNMNNTESNGTAPNSWQHTLSEFLRRLEDNDDPDDHFQDLTALLVNAKTKKS